MIKTFLDGMQLPVNPLNELTFSVSAGNEEFEVVALGEVTRIGHRGLVKIEIESVFANPQVGYGFAAMPNARQPIEYIRAVQDIMSARRPTRLIVTGDKTDVNMLCSISDFKYRQAHGEEGEYYYSLSLKEYREARVRRVSVRQGTDAASLPPVPQRTESVPVPATYTVRPGDSLYAIAKTCYGNSDWRKIYEANKSLITNPNLIYPNQVLTIPQ